MKYDMDYFNAFFERARFATDAEMIENLGLWIEFMRENQARYKFPDERIAGTVTTRDNLVESVNREKEAKRQERISAQKVKEGREELKALLRKMVRESGGKLQFPLPDSETGEEDA